VPILLLALVSKGQRANLSKAERNALRAELMHLADDYRFGVLAEGQDTEENTMTTFGQRLIESAREARAIARGEVAPARIFVPPDIDVAAIRKRLGLSQAKFAQRFGLSPATLRDWEQGRRRPDRTARTLLTVIDRDPEAVARALTGA
jgi:putative transcriptional regulator